MKFKTLALLVLLTPSLVFADSSFFTWITNLKVVPEIKDRAVRFIPRSPKPQPVLEETPVETAQDTSSSSTTQKQNEISTSALSTLETIIKNQIATTTKAISNLVKPDESAQIAKLKADNDALKKTIANLQQTVATLTGQNNACMASSEKLQAQSSPKALARIKTLEWLIVGTLNSNYRNSFDADGNRQAEMVVNTAFFRSPSAEEFRNMIKEYDDLTGSTLYPKFKDFVLSLIHI